MFDTPQWMGSFITSRSNQEINRLNREHEVIMEDIKHQHEYAIQESRNRTTEDVARMNRESSEEIARLNRVHEAEMVDAKNRNAISVALIQAASQATGKALPYVLPAFIAGKVSNKDGNSKGNGSGPKNVSNPDTKVVVHKTTSEVRADESRRKADDLFPELEPTFGVTLMNGTELSRIDNKVMPSINVTQLVPAIGAVLTMAAPYLAIL